MRIFEIGKSYTRRDIYALLQVPEHRQHGSWNRGYCGWQGDMFIFATVGVSTTSGFDYPNALHADGSMTWTGVDQSHPGQPQIQSILDVSSTTHVFVRSADRDPFIYLGVPRKAELLGERPARMHFQFGEERKVPTSSGTSFREGAERDVKQSLRERSPAARAECLEHWGSTCVVCQLDAPWNHVHHLYPIAEGAREVNPITDLRPVCPSCHGMIHWFRPMLNIEEARHLWTTEIAAVGKDDS